ncbi:MAG TPA: serine/threonine-protein kinase [Ktedonobacteraceae bacterium]
MDIKELLGVTLGSCTIERIIGRGGMGAVFLAQQSRPSRAVAVKVLIPASGYDPDELQVFLERFRREADTVAKLEHANILPIYEYEEAIVCKQRLAYLVMPYVRGGTLRERMDEMHWQGRQFDLSIVGNYISQVADALSYAHSQGVVHRDIKPGNLLFHSDGRLLLSDFGIVHLSAMPSLTKVGSFVGTAEYASPEQVSGSVVETRSDIYSLGIILFELLVGSVPFTGPNSFAVMSRQLNDPVPSVRALRPDLSPAIDFVVRKALAKNPQDRYQSANELAADFQAAIAPVLAQSARLRLNGDAKNNDLTLSNPSWQQPLGPGGTIPYQQAIRAYPPTVSATPPRTSDQGSWQQRPESVAVPLNAPPGSVMAPLVGVREDQVLPVRTTGDGDYANAINEMGAGASNGQYALPVSPLPPTIIAESDAPKAAYRQGRRLYYYGVALIALLLQFFVLILLLAPLNTDTASSVILSILLGLGIDMLALASIVFTGVTRNRSTHKFFYRGLIVTILAPLVSAIFIKFGMPTSGNGIHVPIVSYLVLLLSNIYTIRQLGQVDAPKEQIEAAPVLWRPAIIGALTGLLPLTMILIFTLVTPVGLLVNAPLLTRMFAVLFLAFIGAPTPGAMMAIWLSQKMTFPTLLRSSAIAGMLMFLAAFQFIALWGLAPANYTLFDYFNKPGLAALTVAGLLALIGMLRGMLDAKVYFWLSRSRKP